MFELRSFKNPDELAATAARDWLGELAARKTADAPEYTVALSGGRVTKTFFSEIVSAARAEADVFAAVHFFWADERCVPPTDPESNYAMAKELLFGPLKISEIQIHRLRGEAPEASALGEAMTALRDHARAEAGKMVLDMIFLGMGEDGHVASLFPGESEEVRNDPAVYRAVTAVKPPPRRITLGYSTIVEAQAVWVLASGAGKEGALKQSLSPTGKTPMGRVLQMRAKAGRPTLIYTDIAVAR
jgi:6-phosphogluconolactonase